MRSYFQSLTATELGVVVVVMAAEVAGGGGVVLEVEEVNWRW